MIYSIQNEYLELKVSEIGAELISLQNTLDGQEFIWQGDARYWEDHSPLLFPAVGDWKDNQYKYDGVTYEMPLHGFARTQRFDINCSENEIVCILDSNEETLKYYPFLFRLTIVYSLDKNTLHVEQYIRNMEEKKMPYSIGEHVGFRIPLFDNERYEDYYVEFEKEETACRYPLIDGKEIGNPIPCLNKENRIRLTEDMFVEGAWNFENLCSERVSLQSDVNDVKIIIDFPNFSHFSIWSVPKAPYICIEPCKGMAASSDEGYNPFEKRGICILDGKKEDIAVYSISIETSNIKKKLEKEFANSVIEKRVSVRMFSKRVVTREKVKAVLRHAMAAPSAGNNREWEFFVINREHDKKEISRMSPYAGPAKEANVLIIPCVNNEKVKEDNQGNMWWIEDMAACSQTILLAAKEEGLDSVWMGFYPDTERVSRLAKYLNCEKKMLPFAVIALGYAKEKNEKKERYDDTLIHYL